LLHVTLYGLVGSVPISVVPAKKLTLLTVPSASPAVALSVTVAGAVNVAPAAGAVNDTVGAWFAAALTVIDRAAVVVVAPVLSVATAVSE
jgi:hypothetical protein